MKQQMSKIDEIFNDWDEEEFEDIDSSKYVLEGNFSTFINTSSHSYYRHSDDNWVNTGTTVYNNETTIPYYTINTDVGATITSSQITSPTTWVTTF